MVLFGFGHGVPIVVVHEFNSREVDRFHLQLLLFHPVRGQDAPSNKLNIAVIGAWGRAKAHFSAISSENVVAPSTNAPSWWVTTAS